MRDSLLPDAQVFLVEDAGIRDTMFVDLLNQIEWKQSQSVVYGKAHNQPRLTAYYGAESYDYAGVYYHPEHFEKVAALKECKERVEQLIDHQFNAVVCNLYRDGNDSIGWHSDNELELGFRPVIASLSFGATRRMSFRRRKVGAGQSDRRDIELPSGSLLVMFGQTQQCWEHAIHKSKKVVEPRINLTFRWMAR